MKLKATGVICPECLTPTIWRVDSPSNTFWDCWLGYVKEFVCSDCHTRTVLLLDDRRRVVMLLTEEVQAERFIASAGRWQHQTDEIPF
jgi:hypothetical protein